MAIDEKLYAWIRGGEEPSNKRMKVESLVGTIVFWVLEAFVLVAFFDQLRLRAISEPMGEALTSVAQFIPRLLVALLIALIAYLIARLVRSLTVKGLHAVGFDEKAHKYLTDESAGTPGPPERAGYPPAPAPPATTRTTPSHAIGTVVFWLLMLLALPLILGVLQLEGLLGPVEEMVGKALAFLPNLLLAAVILGVGYVVAKLIRQIVTNLLAAVGVDALGRKVLGETDVSSVSLSRLLGYVVFVLVLIPVVISALQALELEALTQPAQDMLQQVLAAIPKLFAAAIVLLVFYFVGKLLADLVTNLLLNFGFDDLVRRAGLSASVSGPASTNAPATSSPSRVAGTVLLVIIMLLATQEALSLLNFEHLAALVARLLAFLGHVVLGLIIIGLGLYLANLAARLIRGTGVGNADLLARIARVAIVVLAVFMGLQEMGVGEGIVMAAFIAVMAGGALALGLAFGLGGRDLAQRKLDQHAQ